MRPTSIRTGESRDYASPINEQWGYDNRTAGFRIPQSDPENTRIENRVAGADGNPYLVLAASLACGLLGMKENLRPTEPMAGSAYDLPFALPRGLETSLQHLAECPELSALMGERFVKAYNAVKQCEYNAYRKVISSWEREYLLLNV